MTCQTCGYQKAELFKRCPLCAFCTDCGNTIKNCTCGEF